MLLSQVRQPPTVCAQSVKLMRGYLTSPSKINVYCKTDENWWPFCCYGLAMERNEIIMNYAVQIQFICSIVQPKDLYVVLTYDSFIHYDHIC